MMGFLRIAPVGFLIQICANRPGREAVSQTGVSDIAPIHVTSIPEGILTSSPESGPGAAFVSFPEIGITLSKWLQVEHQRHRVYGFHVMFFLLRSAR